MNAKHRPAVSVVIPALNEERYLPRLLDSLLRCGGSPLDIIVVDGRSEDGTCAVVAARQGRTPPLVTLRLANCPVRNVSTQRNLGASLARHDVLMFLDADTEVPSPRQFGELLGRFVAGGYAAACCRMTPIERDARARACYGALYVFQKGVARWNPYGLGACLLTRRTVFDACGGFDPTIRVNEDAHYCRRASRLGRFTLLPVSMRVSARRFRKHGYGRTALQYLRIFLDRSLRGEMRDDRIPYEFGEY